MPRQKRYPNLGKKQVTAVLLKGLESKHAIEISRKREKVPCFGGTTNPCRYWIDVEERGRFNNLKAKKEATHNTDQDKESGSLNVDSLAKKPTG